MRERYENLPAIPNNPLGGSAPVEVPGFSFSVAPNNYPGRSYFGSSTNNPSFNHANHDVNCWMLESVFKDLVAKYTDDQKLADEFWAELVRNYSARKRHYHNLRHLENVLAALLPVKSTIADWDCILFSLFYHDIIYNVLRSDNEEKSAGLAVARMQQINIDPGKIELCREQIHATKSHAVSNNDDTNHFTDADLSVLGQPWEIYMAYADGVREEFSIYPDFIYKPGRRKVLQHFLAMDRIFKTSYFHEKLEQQARENIANELIRL